VSPYRAYVVDDEPLAVRRLVRMIERTGRFEVIGSATDPRAAIEFLPKNDVDVVFLDIRMPGMTGFEFLAQLPAQPMVVFTTAFDEYALKAFDVNSVDYLLKPVEAEQLARVIRKLDRFRAGGTRGEDFRAVFEKLAAAIRPSAAQYPERLAGHAGARLEILAVANITHFYARDKLTWAAAEGRSWSVDHSIAELEQKLDPRTFLRIHRATLVNLAWAGEVHRWFARGVMLRLRDPARTELAVARDRVSALKERLGF
jgi:two-component system LytT family response regulator